MSTLESIQYKRGELRILDQLLLPHQSVYIDIKTVGDAWTAINSMNVRGAPAIAIVAALSLAVELSHDTDRFEHAQDLAAWVEAQAQYLVTARPTAVNLKNMREAMADLVEDMVGDEAHVDMCKEYVIEAAEQMVDVDRKVNKSIGDYGAEAITLRSGKQKVNVLHHCNTGSLATAGYGTALGVIRSLFTQGRLEMAYYTETRPYYQGARLTAYEMIYEKIPATLICDNMAGWLMKTTDIDAVIVGSDSVAANGDVANKIGTYSLAVLAKYHSVPFYAAVPSSTLGFGHKHGDHIPIEQRPHHEMTHIHGIPVAPHGVVCWNPAFDVTPAHLVTGGIVTEFGVFPANRLEEASLNDWKLSYGM